MDREELLKIAKPILFNTEMVKAILEDRKGATRRILKLPSHVKQSDNGLYTLFAEGTCYENQSMEEIKDYIKSPFKAGDYLYVRETWHKDVGRYMYKASYTDGEKFYRNGIEVLLKWHPSIHMPKEAARIFLRVKDVRVERLQDITVLDAINEGCCGTICDHIDANPELGCTDCYNTGWLERPETEFALLWDTTVNKADVSVYGWDANPWVWVIEFEMCEKPEDM